MTVCVGAICADLTGEADRAVVIASDRMVTMGGLIEFEHEIPKVTQITPRAVALVAGDARRGNRLVRDLSAAFQGGAPSVQQVAAQAALHYAALRREQLEIELFVPRGLTMEQFYTELQQKLNPQITFNMDNYVAAFDYGVELLVAGVDDTGGHVFSIGNPGGGYNDSLPVGYLAVGSGALHAIQSLIGARHTGARSLDETIFAVYMAKRRSEVAPGVGHDTDLWVITKHGIYRLSHPELAQLDELIVAQQQPIRQELKDRVRGLALFAQEGTDATS